MITGKRSTISPSVRFLSGPVISAAKAGLSYFACIDSMCSFNFGSSVKDPPYPSPSTFFIRLLQVFRAIGWFAAGGLEIRCGRYGNSFAKTGQKDNTSATMLRIRRRENEEQR
jgi:hypothetical protein